MDDGVLEFREGWRSWAGQLMARTVLYQQEKIDALLEVLYEVEFNGPNGANPICPSCYGWSKHEAHCRLAAAIKKGESK